MLRCFSGSPLLLCEGLQSRFLVGSHWSRAGDSCVSLDAWCLDVIVFCSSSQRSNQIFILSCEEVSVFGIAESVVECYELGRQFQLAASSSLVPKSPQWGAYTQLPSDHALSVGYIIGVPSGKPTRCQCRWGSGSNLIPAFRRH